MLSVQTQAQIERERRRRAGVYNPTTRYERFQELYFDDWSGFILDCFKWTRGEGPADYQVEIIGDLQEKGRAACRGPFGLGKTSISAWVILAFALTRDGRDWKAITTASRWNQLINYTWPEVHKWANRLRWDKIGRGPFTRDELLTRSLKLSTGAVTAIAPDKPEALEGGHADQILYVFDEAKAIPDGIFDSAEGAFSGAGGDTGREAFALAISTPGEPVGRFYDIHARKRGFSKWAAIHIGLDRPIEAGRISEEWAEDKRELWGEDSPLYKTRVLGEFAESGTDSVLSLSRVEAAMNRFEDWLAAGRPGTFTALGADIAEGGEQGDKNILALAYDDHIIGELRELPPGETAIMGTVGAIVGILAANGGLNGKGFALIDTVGVGAGAIQRLREQGYTNRALSFKAGEATDWRDKSGELSFADKRAAAWWIVREMLAPDSGVEVILPKDDELLGELVAPKWRVESSGKLRVESKDDIRKRLKRSTNKADAVIQALAGKLLLPLPNGLSIPVDEEARSRWATSAQKEVPVEVASRPIEGGSSRTRSRWRR